MIQCGVLFQDQVMVGLCLHDLSQGVPMGEDTSKLSQTILHQSVVSCIELLRELTVLSGVFQEDRRDIREFMDPTLVFLEGLDAIFEDLLVLTDDVDVVVSIFGEKKLFDLEVLKTA